MHGLLYRRQAHSRKGGVWRPRSTSKQVQRTISIEVGMQNSGLAVVLARNGGFTSPLTALPGAISAVIHCLIGSALAAVWRRRSP